MILVITTESLREQRIREAEEELEPRILTVETTPIAMG
jgi:hypothetical protein